MSSVEEGDMTKNTGKSSFNANLFERVRDMRRAWLERLQETRRIESDFGRRLLTAKSSAEALGVCSEWMAKHVETIASERRRFATAWLGLIFDVTTTDPPTSAEPSDRDHKSEL
jgi:hypothetical protein